MGFKKLLPTLAASGAGGTSWTNVDNIKAEDSSWARCDIDKNDVSQWCQGFGYNFNIPPSATIEGITVFIKIDGEDDRKLTDSQIFLMDTAGGQKGTNHARNAPVSESTVTEIYGNSADLWGTTWTPADVNHSNFGAMLEYANSDNSKNWVDIDVVWVQVDYSVSGTYMLQMSAF